jgi:quinol monooxygenase YgiN
MTGVEGSEAIVYVDESEVREGALEAVKEAIGELVEFIAANEPQLLAYNVYLNDDGTRMTVIHVNRDAASLEYHLEVGGPAFRKFADLIRLLSIHVYGRPSAAALEQLNAKAQMLGGGTVVVHERQGGFVRLGADREY